MNSVEETAFEAKICTIARTELTGGAGKLGEAGGGDGGRVGGSLRKEKVVVEDRPEPDGTVGGAGKDGENGGGGGGVGGAGLVKVKPCCFGGGEEGIEEDWGGV